MKVTTRRWLKLIAQLASAFPVEISLFIGFLGWLQVFHFMRQLPGLDGPMPNSRVLTALELVFLVLPWVLFFVFLRRERQSPQVRVLLAVPCLLGAFLGLLILGFFMFFSFAIGGMLVALALYTLITLTLLQGINLLRGIFRGFWEMWRE